MRDDPVMRANCSARERAAVVVDGLEGAVVRALFLFGDEKVATVGRLKEFAERYREGGMSPLPERERLFLGEMLERVARWLDGEAMEEVRGYGDLAGSRRAEERVQ